MRVLIEGIINAAYILESADQLAEDYADFPRFFAWKQFQDIQAVAPEITTDQSEEEKQQMKANFEATRSRYEKHRNGDWAEHNIFQRAHIIDGIAGFNLFRSLMNVGWRTAGAYVHSTATSLKSRFREDENSVVIRRTPTPEESASVLHICNMAMFSLIAILDLRLGRKKVGEWHRLYEDWTGDSKPSAITADVSN